MPIRPRSPYEVAVLEVGRGLNLTDSPDKLEPGEAVSLKNMIVAGVGRLSPRKSHVAIDPAGASGSVPASTTHILGVFPHAYGADAAGSEDTGALVLTLTSSTDTVYLNAVNAFGREMALLDTDGIPDGWESAEVSADYTNTGSDVPIPIAASLNGILFMTDEKKHLGLTFYDPTAASGSKLYQPLFVFDGGTATPVYGRCIAAYNNMLFVSGYLSENAQDRPEVVRFSYIGLTGGGATGGQVDGGDAGSTSSDENLFDVSDYFSVGQRGVAVTGMAAGGGRLIIATERETYSLYGYDRNSFRLDLVDPHIGCAATRSMISVDGIVYWWSKMGPVRFVGGDLDTNFGRKLLPRFGEVDTDTMFAVHVPSVNEVRFYYRESSDSTNDFPTLGMCYNYRYNTWRDEELEFAVVCGGYAREGSGASSGPASAPTNLSLDAVQNTQFTANWDAGVGIQEDATTELEVYYNTSIDPGGSADETHSLENDVTSKVISGLSEDTDYFVKVFHRRNGQNSTTDTATTTTSNNIPAPTNFTATDDPYESGGTTYPSVLLAWTNNYDDVKTKIYRDTTYGFTPNDSNNLIHTTNINDSGYRDEDVIVGATYYYQIASYYPPSSGQSSYVEDANGSTGVTTTGEENPL